MQIWSLLLLQKMYNQKCKNPLWLWWKADWSVSAEACLILSEAVWSYFHICICKAPSPDASELLSNFDLHGDCSWLTDAPKAAKLPYHHLPSVDFSIQQIRVFTQTLQEIQMTNWLFVWDVCIWKLQWVFWLLQWAM